MHGYFNALKRRLLLYDNVCKDCNVWCGECETDRLQREAENRVAQQRAKHEDDKKRLKQHHANTVAVRLVIDN